MVLKSKAAKNTPKLVKSAIISCSRRTDIPAFLMDWVVDKIKNRQVDVKNPFNPNQISRVSLDPVDVKCWAWWSKNYRDWIITYETHRELFDAYKGHYFQFTINSPSELESGLHVSLEDRFKQVEFLIDTFGIDAMNFRFDPIVIYRRTGSKQQISNLSKFEYIIDNLGSLGIKSMIFSFATIYSKVEKRMRARGKEIIELPFKKKKEIVERMKKACDEYGMRMQACCQPDLLKIEGIEQAHCIDALKIERLIGEKIKKKKDTGQREACGCYKSKDIGGYHGIFRCKHNCDYCYASPARK